MKRSLLVLSFLTATNLALAQSRSAEPDRFPVQAGFVAIADGSYHVVILAEDKAFSNFCGPEWKVGLIQTQFVNQAAQTRTPTTNPNGCWITGANGSVSFKYFDMTAGAPLQFNIQQSSLKPMIYEWRSERLFSVSR